MSSPVFEVQFGKPVLVFQAPDKALEIIDDRNFAAVSISGDLEALIDSAFDDWLRDQYQPMQQVRK
jgi:hypothetical protein